MVDPVAQADAALYRQFDDTVYRFQWFDYDHTEGWAGKFDFSRGNNRRDISLYPAVVFFKFAEFAIGCSYTTQDEAFPIVGGNTNLPITTIDASEEKFGIYFHFGVGGTIHIAGPVGIPLGILFKTDGPNGIAADAPSLF